MGQQGKPPRGAERRRDPRYNRALPLRVGDRGAEGLRAESINVSTRGLYCKVPRYVPPFSKLKVALDLPFAAREPATLECEGVVVRVEPEAESPGVGEYKLAIYFLELPKADAALIEAFLAESH
ncbi:MAG: hypothetical protein Kow0092_19140 [Deferrisomatales bacterium]